MSDIQGPDKQSIRKVLFTPCESKEHLATWIRFFLNLDLPDCTVLEESNSNPMDVIWELYQRIINGASEDFSRVMVYASRFGFKTMSASILECLALFHTEGGVGHMAASKEQSKRSQEYVRDFLSKPYLIDFATTANASQSAVVRYEKNGVILSEKEFEALTEADGKSEFKRTENRITIVVCTLRGANGLHARLLCVDEIDTISGENVRGYKESKNIPTSQDGKLPLTILTSTRKFSYGLVQRELDNAKESGLVVRHWNSIDMARACPPSRYKPDEPMVDLWVNDDKLDVLDKAGMEALDEKTAEGYIKTKAYSGCRKCPIFAACKTQLVNKQKSNSKMLTPVEELSSKFLDQDEEEITTQLLCRKPSSAGLVYPRLSEIAHAKTATQIAEMITGEPQNQPISNERALELLKELGADFYLGIDWGLTHNFAAVLGARYGSNIFIVGGVVAPNLDLDDRVAVCRQFLEYNPRVFADPAEKVSTKFFKKHGFRTVDWEKGPGSVKAGIDLVKTKIKNAAGHVSLFFLANEPNVLAIWKSMSGYHYLTDKTGNISDVPDEENDDAADALRYLVMNVVAPKGRVRIEKEREPTPITPQKTSETETLFKKEVSRILNKTEEEKDSGTIVKKGRFIFDG